MYICRECGRIYRDEDINKEDDINLCPECGEELDEGVDLYDSWSDVK